ncbi:MAG: C39 family peptidase [Paenibacillaceae bacterium]
MIAFGQLMKYSLSVMLIIGLVFSSGVFSILLYGKLTDESEAPTYYINGVEVNPNQAISLVPSSKLSDAPKIRKASAMLTAPIISQYPELRSGCEITTLAMLLQYYGIKKSKLDLLPEMKYDKTPVTIDGNKKITYWGNPNIGFVGDVTGRAKGFGIYHTALIKLLQKYIPTAEDFTGKSFEDLEDKVAEGIPVEVWTTIRYQESVEWTVWETLIGPIRTTFSEHAVLLVGYDKDNVYVNDPYTGLSQVKVNKAQFIRTWEMMGKQAITYTKGATNHGL